MGRVSTLRPQLHPQRPRRESGTFRRVQLPGHGTLAGETGRAIREEGMSSVESNWDEQIKSLYLVVRNWKLTN